MAERSWREEPQVQDMFGTLAMLMLDEEIGERVRELVATKPRALSQELRTALVDDDGDTISSGTHRRIVHQRTEVCDTCTNAFGINVRWDQAHPVTTDAS